MTDTTPRATSIRALPLSPNGEVQVNLTSNDVRIRGVEGDTLTIHASSGEDLDDELVIEGDGDRIVIRDADRAFRLGPVRLRSRGSAALDIDLPRTARLSLRTLSGDVEAAGVGAESSWATVSGDLRLGLAGGAVSVESMSGDVTVRSDGAAGIKGRTVSGDIRVHAPQLDALALSTASGDITAEGPLGAAFEHVLSSVSGDIQLQTPSPVRLETQSIAGDVRASGNHRTEGGRGRRTIVVGDGSVRVTARTTSGDIRLRQSPAAMPGVPATPPLPRVPEAPTPPVPPVPAEHDRSWVVAEAEAALNLVRPAAAPAPTDAADEVPDAAWSAGDSVTDRREAARLDILRALERGELDIEAASHRLEQLEDAGPRHFRGFC